MANIERSNEAGRFSSADLSAKVRESRTYWNSPEGQRRQRELDAEKRTRATDQRRVKFPNASGTKASMHPSVQHAAARLGLL